MAKYHISLVLDTPNSHDVESIARMLVEQWETTPAYSEGDTLHDIVVFTVENSPTPEGNHIDDCGVWIDEPCNCMFGRHEL